MWGVAVENGAELTVTRHPTGQDLKCLVCGTDKDIDIDHVVNRGMGGSKARDVPENKVPLCRECHTAKTNGVLETKVESRGDNVWAYYWRRKGSTAPYLRVPVEVSQRYKCLVGRLSDAAEAAVNSGAHAEQNDTSGSSASSLKEEIGGASFSTMQKIVRQEEESDGLERETAADGTATGDSDRTPVGLRDRSGMGNSDDNLHPDSTRLTHDQRVAIAAGIKEMEWGRQWLAGDTANEWEEELGEDFWNRWANEFGYTYPSLRNAMRVSRQIPEELRNPRLRQSYHVVVADLPRLSIVLWLHKCETEDWRVAEFRRQVKGERPRVKRYSMEELRVAAEAICVEHDLLHHDVSEFLDWLGEQG